MAFKIKIPRSKLPKMRIPIPPPGKRHKPKTAYDRKLIKLKDKKSFPDSE